MQGEAFFNAGGGGRAAGLVIDDCQRAVSQLVDPVGPAVDAHPQVVHFTTRFADQHPAAIAFQFGDLGIDPFKAPGKARPPQRANQRMRAHFVQFFRRQRQQLARAASCFVPAFEHAVNHFALPRGGGFGIEQVERLEPQDRGGIELVWIAAQPVERGDRQRHVALRRGGTRFWLRISGRGCRPVDPPRQVESAQLAVFLGQFAQHRLNPQHKAAGDHRAAFIAQRPA